MRITQYSGDVSDMLDIELCNEDYTNRKNGSGWQESKLNGVWFKGWKLEQNC